MRITTANSFETSVGSLARRQTDLNEAQTQMTSLKRVNKASDDPASAAIAERALASVTRIDFSKRAVEASRNVMTQTESTLGDAGELMQQAREALVAAGNASYSSKERLTLSNQISGIRDQLLKLANEADGAGNYLFGAQGSDQPPFVDAVPTRTGVVFQGVAGHLDTASATDLPLSTDLSSTWQDVFASLDQAVVDLGDPANATLTSVQVTALNTTNLGRVDGALNALQSARAAAGEALNRADGITGRLDTQKVLSQTDRANAEDLDMVQAISEFQNKQSGYDAALKSYSMVQRMSLFQYLNV